MKLFREHALRRRWIRRLMGFMAALVFIFIVLNILFPLRINIHYSQIIAASDGTVLHAFLSKDDKWRLKTELKEITPTLKKAIIFKEDKYFYYHPGINPVAIVRAIFNNTIKGKKTSGASTITMQVARMVEPKDRTYVNKLVEMFRSFQLELFYSKDEILQFYLNLVPFGSNIEGVKSASLIYLQQPPDYMSLAQTVALSIIPNRPSSLLIGRDNERIIEERNKWLKRLAADKVFLSEDIEDALLEPFHHERHDVPKLAPHLALRLAASHKNQPIIHSGIDRAKQELSENLAFNYIRRIHYKGITNCAVLIIDNKENSVKVYVGSSDFYNAADNGQVDGIRAIRSPGSTLKPFLYATAFDHGIFTPKMIITDVPQNFSGYRPENFDKRFHGNISIEFALANSLNMPAVKVLDALGLKTFTTVLTAAGFSQIAKDDGKLGLSTILGGCGVTLEQLTALYACLADEGQYRNLKWTENEMEKRVEHKLFSQAAAFMTTEILTKHTRPDLPNNFESSMHLPKVAWKTGTSYGRRDAWSIGYNKEYTIGVWVGNFSGHGIPELTGADIATPLLFDLFNTLSYQSANDWFQMPKHLDFRYVCPESGLIPGEGCEGAVMDYFIPGTSTMQKCNHTKDIFVSVDESYSFCRNCLPEAGYKKKSFPNLPPELISYYEAEHIPYDKVPPHNPACSRIYTENAPAITAPAEGAEYLLEQEEHQQLMLACNADNEVSSVNWYINNKFYASARAHEKIFFEPEAGIIKISCTDDKGRNSDVMIDVKYLE
ncbi:MAG: penicillin-binding protein 1C [Chitinophagales bacterium]|nr:penicillin-binding protein 1C [Chitinophagales bacterium]